MSAEADLPAAVEPDLTDNGKVILAKFGLDGVKDAVDLWNAFATAKRLPTVQKLTDARKTKLRLRLRDAGGIEGWKAALERVAASPGLLGDNDRGWTVHLDFLLQESPFARLMEGGYASWGRSRPKPKAHPADWLIEEIMQGSRDGDPGSFFQPELKDFGT